MSSRPTPAGTQNLLFSIPRIHVTSVFILSDVLECEEIAFDWAESYDTKASNTPFAPPVKAQY